MIKTICVSNHEKGGSYSSSFTSLEAMLAWVASVATLHPRETLECHAADVTISFHRTSSVFRGRVFLDAERQCSNWSQEKWEEELIQFLKPRINTPLYEIGEVKEKRGFVMNPFSKRLETTISYKVWTGTRWVPPYVGDVGFNPTKEEVQKWANENIHNYK